jgi:hypothetical protein
MSNQKKPLSSSHLKEVQMVDKRLIARHIDKGFITADAVEKQLEKLPDLADRAENIAHMVYPHHHN